MKTLIAFLVTFGILTVLFVLVAGHGGRSITTKDILAFLVFLAIFGGMFIFVKPISPGGEDRELKKGTERD